MLTCKRRVLILIASLIGVLVAAVACGPTPKPKPDRLQSTVDFDPRIADVTRRARVPTCDGRNAKIEPDAKIVVLAPYELSQTHQRHPSLFWYYGLNVTCPAELIISEKEGPTVLLPRQLPRPNVGINRIDLADSQYNMNVNLEPNIIYQWSIRVRFDFETRPSAYPIASGFIKRREIPYDEIKRIEQEPDHIKVEKYAEKDFWYDALSSVSALREAQPQNLKLKKLHIRLLIEQRLPEYVISVVQ